MTTTRNPDQTRATLLDAAFEEIFEHGFQGMRVDDVLARAGLKKGAFYHHFESKQALGYAVLNEIIGGFIGKRWTEGMVQGEDPIQALEDVIDKMVSYAQPGKPFCGCPLNNVAQEMAPLDAGFQERIEQLFEGWIGVIAEAFARGQENGTIRKGIDPHGVAMFVVAAIEGCVGLTKASQDPGTFTQCREQLSGYLGTLRPTP